VSFDMSPPDCDQSPAAYNVLQVHQQRNRIVRPPDSNRVHDKRNAQPRPLSPVPEDNMHSLHADADSPAKSRAPRNSKAQGGPKPTHVRYYSGLWQDILEQGKNQYCLYLGTEAETPFPEGDDKTRRAAIDSLFEVISLHEHDPSAQELDYGKPFLSRYTVTYLFHRRV